jgi:predicted dehydrogenase
MPRPPIKNFRSKIRLGIIGLGQIAVKTHLPRLQKMPHLAIQAIYSSRLAHARKIAQQYKIIEIFHHWEELLQSHQIEAVLVCTPNFTHFPIVMDALRNHKHVLVEKPMCLTIHQADQIIHQAQNMKRVLLVGHNMRFDPVVRTAQKMLHDNKIGSVFSFHATLAHSGPQVWSPKAKWFLNPAQVGGGVLMDLGIHVFDTLRFLLNESPKAITALQPKKNSSQLTSDVHCSVLLEFPSGILGTIQLSWRNPSYKNQIYLWGEKGSMQLNLSQEKDPIILEFKHSQARSFPRIQFSALKFSMYDYFVQQIHGKAPAYQSAQDSREALRTVLAGYQSMRVNRKIWL